MIDLIRTIVMILLGLGLVLNLIFCGAYVSGYEHTSKGLGSALASILSALFDLTILLVLIYG